MNKKRTGEMIELSLSSRDFVHHERIDARGSEVREEKEEYAVAQFLPFEISFFYLWKSLRTSTNRSELLER